MDLSKEVQEEIQDKLKAHLESELDVSLGQFEAADLLDFIAKNLGPYFYNQGLADAQAVLAAKLDEVENAILEIEKPVR